MDEEICNNFKIQLKDNIQLIAFENATKWKNTLNFLAYLPQHSLTNIISILNSRSTPTKVLKLSEWQALYPDATTKNTASAIPLIDNTNKESIAYDGWDIHDIIFQHDNVSYPKQIKDILNIHEYEPSYWKSLVIKLMKKNMFFISEEIQNNKFLFEFIEKSILWTIDPVIFLQDNPLENLNSFKADFKSLSNEMLLDILSNVIAVLNALPDYHNEKIKNEKVLEENAEKSLEIWNRMNRTLPVRIQDAKDYLEGKNTKKKNTTSSANSIERKLTNYEQLQSAIDGAKS